MQKLCFLDVDGPLIPNGMFFINYNASFERICSPISIAIVNKLCEQSDCKVVTNSTHNYCIDKLNRNLKEALIENGIKEEYFHTLWRTNYGFVGRGSDDRLLAIKRWYEEADKTTEYNYEGCLWVCFDDQKFTKYDHRLILIDSDTGITPKHYLEAMKLLDCETKLIF